MAFLCPVRIRKGKKKKGEELIYHIIKVVLNTFYKIFLISKFKACLIQSMTFHCDDVIACQN